MHCGPPPQLNSFLDAFRENAAVVVEALEAPEPEENRAHAHHTKAMIALAETKRTLFTLVDDVFQDVVDHKRARLSSLQHFISNIQGEHVEALNRLVALSPEFDAIPDTPPPSRQLMKEASSEPSEPNDEKKKLLAEPASAGETTPSVSMGSSTASNQGSGNLHSVHSSTLKRPKLANGDVPRKTIDVAEDLLQQASGTEEISSETQSGRIHTGLLKRAKKPSIVEQARSDVAFLFGSKRPAVASGTIAASSANSANDALVAPAAIDMRTREDAEQSLATSSASSGFAPVAQVESEVADYRNSEEYKLAKERMKGVSLLKRYSLNAPRT